MQYTFKRYEKKFLLTNEMYNELLVRIAPHTVEDKYALTNIYNIYYDTPQWSLIRTSIDKPVYKEKLRVRSYGLPSGGDRVFVEIKKKYKGVVYKRRVRMPYDLSKLYLAGKIPAQEPNQITREIDWFCDSYENLMPMMFIAYDRYSLMDKDDLNVRITFDHNIRWRSDHVSFRYGDGGEQLLEPGMRLLEIKVPNSIPLWLSNELTKIGANSTSYSKYGNSYLINFLKQAQKPQQPPERKKIYA